MVIRDMNGQMSLFEGIRPLKITKPLRLVELFAGIGAQAKALENLGVEFEHYRICELDKFAVASYNAVHRTNFVPSDITKIHAADLGIVDTDKYDYIMTYSFPCTDLSTAGRQAGMSKGSGTRSGLLWEVERLLKEMNELPQILLMENVPGVISKKFCKDFYEWCVVLSALGYTNKFALLNAKDYGIPQNRERVFMISWREDGLFYEFPKPQSCNDLLVDYLEQNVPDKYLLSTTILNGFIQKTIRDKQESKGFRFAPTIGICVAKTIVTRAGNKPTDNFIISSRGIRRLTPCECWRLMGFDDESFKRAAKVNSDTQLYKQAGNSIVVAVLEAIFKQLF